MHSRTNRLFVAALLVAAGIAGGFFLVRLHQAGEAALTSSADLSATLERITDTIGDVSAAQQAYVAAGQPTAPWLERSAALLRQLADDTAALRGRLHSTRAPRFTDEARRGLQALNAIDGKARRDIEQGQNLLAADLIFSDGRDAVTALLAAVRDLKAAEYGDAALERASGERLQLAVLVAIAGLWAVGLGLLTPLRTPVAPAPAIRDPEIDTVVPDTHSSAAVDLTAAAEVCGALAQLSDATALSDVLGRAADVLDARGIIVWMGAGDELFAAVSHGYEDHLIGRLGPIPRLAANATAESWRTSQVRTVASDGTTPGAIAAPLIGVRGCVGVFTAELRAGREGDTATRAVAVMIASHLAAILPEWPAASTATPGEGLHGPRPLVASAGA